MLVNPNLAPVGAGPSHSPVLGRAVRVVLAEEHAGIRRTLRQLLEREADIELIADGGDLETILGYVRDRSPRVMVLDLSLLGDSSLEAIRDLRCQVPETEIVVLSMQDSPLLARKALDADAIAFVLKEMADSDLPEAIRCAARGVRYVSPTVRRPAAAPNRRTVIGAYSEVALG
jgi:DNA-binding NarL/FixJ family response regulator